ncbi:MAG: SDR family NAD(P)-dependent oxidoreductase [Acidobacteriia bacterium]|nr:SDR family NAD(P)-dependent oxidoreductase [Terriglobia bacterium]
MKKSTIHPTRLLLGGLAVGAGVAVALRRPRKDFELKGKVVLIAGGSRGLGLGLARRFAQEGARLALCARDERELENAASDLKKWTTDVFTMAADVTERSQVEAFVQASLRKFGRIDVLVNNAGLIQVGPLQTLTVEDFETAMKVMYWGHVYASLAVLPDMLQRGEGRIVNITSIGGKVSVPHLVPYSCAKFAAVAFSEGLRSELSGTGVKTVTIAPGLMRTGSFLNTQFKGNDEAEAAWFGVAASLPGLSISAERAVDEIITATKRGTAEKVLGTPAKLLSLFHGVFPGLTADALGMVNRALPRGRGRQMRVMRPYIQRNRLLDKITALGQRAARLYLEEEGTQVPELERV